eukprot:363662-Chlamydomonas_euryale.AAC.28
MFKCVAAKVTNTLSLGVWQPGWRPPHFVQASGSQGDHHTFFRRLAARASGSHGDHHTFFRRLAAR